jgi:hypothetical protein
VTCFWREGCSIACLRGDLWKILVKGVKTPNSPQAHANKPNINTIIHLTQMRY